MSGAQPEMGSAMKAAEFGHLDPTVVRLNHGSCKRARHSGRTLFRNLDTVRCIANVA